MSHTVTDLQFSAMIEGLAATGMTNTEIARKLGCSRQQVWRIETGYSRRPSYELGNRLKQLHDKVVAK